MRESEQGQSYDIASDLDYICHRRRSNTAQRLDRLKKEKMNQSKTTTIVWRCPSPSIAQNVASSAQQSSNKAPNGVSETNDVIHIQKTRSPPIKSGLSRLLEKFPSLPKNPFDEYAQFDGGVSESIYVKKITIFIALDHDKQQNNELVQPNRNSQVDSSMVCNDTSDEEASNPTTRIKTPVKNIEESKSKTGTLEVVIVSSARVQDLIGLICWKYTNEGREPKLHYDINRYCLRIAEENGEVDPDFPYLNPKEPLSKFNFPLLALTEKTDEGVRGFCDQYRGGCIFTRTPTLVENMITKRGKPSRIKRKFTSFTRIIFKDAILDSNQ